MPKPNTDDTIYHTLFNMAADAVLLWQYTEDPGGWTVIEANPAACDRYGYSHEAIIRLTAVDLITVESLGKMRALLSDLIKEDRLIAEVSHVSRDGRQVPTEVNARLFQLNGDTLVLAVCRDISERKAEDRNRQELFDRESGLRAKAEAEIDMRTNYTRALVHELKTPLTSLLASSDYLVGHIKGEPLLSFAKNIAFGAKAVNHRIDELHDLVKLELGTLKLEFYTVNMRRLMCDIAEFVKPTAERSELSFHLELPARMPKVLGDKERLQQVIMNLLNNAFKYTPKKGKVALKAYTQGKELIVEVADSGCGISPSAQKAMFQPYQHRDPSQQRKDGLGLGLVITKAIVERYKGQIWVESELGKGSRFFVALPTIAKGSKDESADN